MNNITCVKSRHDSSPIYPPLSKTLYSIDLESLLAKLSPVASAHPGASPEIVAHAPERFQVMQGPNEV